MAPPGKKATAETATAPDMKSAAEEAVAAACEAVERRRTSMSWNSGSDRTKIAMELAGRLLQWDAARMALEAARLRGKAPRTSPGDARPAGELGGGRSDGQAS